MILLVAELEELKANPDAPASGTVIESHLDPGRGPVVTVLVQRGTLQRRRRARRRAAWGRVRAMHDYTGERVEAAGPATRSRCSASTASARPASASRSSRTTAAPASSPASAPTASRPRRSPAARRAASRLEEVFAKAKQGEIKELNILLKADVSGSLEALQDEIAKLPQDEVAVNMIRAAAGGINESDVMLAAASDAIIIGFNVRPLADARRAAEREGVEIRTYSVIYKVTEELRAAMEGMLEPEEVEETLGEAEILELFKASKVGTIAGCRVTEGKVTRDAEVRLVRDGTVVWTGGRLAAPLQGRRPEVEEGQECGIMLEGFADVKVGDMLEFFETKQVEKTLEALAAGARPSHGAMATPTSA